MGWIIFFGLILIAFIILLIIGITNYNDDLIGLSLAMIIVFTLITLLSTFVSTTHSRKYTIDNYFYTRTSHGVFVEFANPKTKADVTFFKRNTNWYTHVGVPDYQMVYTLGFNMWNQLSDSSLTLVKQNNY